MNRRGRAILLLAALTGPALLAADEAARPDARARAPLYAEDLGPDVIDVSDYPEPYRTIYHERFLPVCSVCHTPARAVNSPFVEADEARAAELRRDQPALFGDPRLLRVEPDIWKRYVKQMGMRPPCCGACPVLSLEQGKELWTFLVYDSLRRKTGPQAAAWQEHRRALLRRFAETDPARYAELYEKKEGGFK